MCTHRLLSRLFEGTDFLSHSYNESLRLAERRLEFDVDELKRVAADAVNRPISDIQNFIKLAEGGFNRVFEVSLKDGKSILARLPYPSTMPRRLAVASEVATLAFARAQGIPVPHVLRYSTDPGSVGSEYILMEKLPGRPIGDAWFNLTEKERPKVLHGVVDLEAKLFNAHLPASGSIYYSHDLPSNIPKIPIPGLDGELCIGPYASLRWWDGKRRDLDIDRGPRKWQALLPTQVTNVPDADPRLVLQAPAEKELAWLRWYGRPRYPFDRAYRETFNYQKQDPKEHVASLKDYIRLAPYLVPTNEKLNLPVLRHPDLQPNNIFVSEDFKITGIIDWQHASVLPTFLAAGMPNSFQNYSDEGSTSFIPPRLPDNLESMDEEEKAEELELFRRRHVHFFYLGFTQRMNEPHWKALEQEGGLLKRRIFDHAGRPWEGLNTPLHVDLAWVAQAWPEIVPPGPDGMMPPCPITISEEEVQKRFALDESLRQVDAQMERINRLLNAGSDGWTSNETYEEAKERARLYKAEGLESISDDPWLQEISDKHWPFDDYDEDE
jgi:hypothetical protein